MAEWHTAGPEAHAGPLGRGTPSTVSTVLLESGRYYQVTITPWPLARHWDMEAVNSMLPRDTALPDGPTTLHPDQPPDPLTTTVLGRTGIWHPGQALYCV